MEIPVVWIKIGQLMLSLSILVVLHELGHFLPAKLFKTKVEKFYLFFNPWFSLFKKKIGETTYGIGWLPLGGYVKIAGMIDESMDKEQMKQPPQPWEFRAKPAWQRLIIMLGGVAVNMLLAMFIYAMLLFKHGETYIPMENAAYGIAVQDSLAYKMGLRSGDKILSIDDQKVERFSDFVPNLVLNGGKTIQIDRNGEPIEINLPEGIISDLSKNSQSILISPRFPVEVLEPAKGSEAERIGLQKGDRLIAVNDKSVPYLDQFTTELKENAGQKVKITFNRSGAAISDSAIITSDGRLGFGLNINPESFFDIKKKEYGFFASFPAGIKQGMSTLNKYIKSIGLLFSGEVKAKDSVGGFISIGKIFPDKWDWIQFWNLTALLSIMLAFVNVLPIPALDGGHALFTIYEIIFRRKPNEKFLEYAQMVGMALLLGLILYVNGLDIIREFFSK